MSLTVSVCICTYNRSVQLARLLTHLQNNVCVPEDVKLDFICIDNNSTDDTLEVANSFKDKLALQVVTESKQGLSNARNKVIETSKADWLIFIDDDVMPEVDFLQAYLSEITAGDTEFIGGRILLNWLQTKPSWLQDEGLPLISGVLGKFDLGAKTISFTELNEAPRGANFAVSRRLLDAVGTFNPDLGVVGAIPGRAEETEYFARAEEQGFVGAYCGAALVYHDALIERLTTRYMLLHGFEKGRAEYKLGNTKVEQLPSCFGLWSRAYFQKLKGRKDRYLQTVVNVGIRRGYQHEKKIAASLADAV